ncbi:MAG: AIR synthase-related protein [Promethearchaeati archaeon SRVP18_Atabeyarchaeia-1]
MSKAGFLPKGKLRGEELSRIVLQHLPMLSGGATINLDFSKFSASSGELIVSCDPIIGIPPEYYGFSAVHVPGADIAVAGVKPTYLELGVYYPPGYSAEWLERNMRDLGDEARRLGIKIIGGHTGGYDGLSQPLISSTCIGVIKNRLLMPSQIEVGDRLLVSGPVTHELAIFLSYVEAGKVEKLLGTKKTAALRKDMKRITVIEPALAAAEAGARAMHDIAEGGTALALKEFSEASRLGIEFNYDLIPWSSEGLSVTKEFGADPLSTSSFGSLLVAVSQDRVEGVLDALAKQGRPAREVGYFLENRGVVVKRGDRRTRLEIGEDIYGRFTPKLQQSTSSTGGDGSGSSFKTRRVVTREKA